MKVVLAVVLALAAALAAASTAEVDARGDAHMQSEDVDRVGLLRGLASRKPVLPADGLAVEMGYNVCLDSIARAIPVAEALHLTSNARALEGRDHALIASVQDFLEVFFLHFAKGAAGERVVTDKAVFAQILALAESESTRVGHPPRVRLGGNAALMALDLDAAGVRVQLGGMVGPQTRALLPSSIANEMNSPADEVHLILEYSKGEVFQGVAAPRANRFIVTNDAGHADVSILASTVHAAVTRGASTDALILSGVHMLEQNDPATWPTMFADVIPQLGQLPLEVTVHLELASVATHAFLRLVAESFFPRVHSIGLNEQELAFLYEALGGQFADADHSANTTNTSSHASSNALFRVLRSREALAGVRPDPIAVAHALRFVLARFPQTLSRIHFHSLAFHIIAERSNGQLHWRRSEYAAAAGAVKAATKACAVTSAEELTDADIELLAPTEFTIPDAVLAREFMVRAADGRRLPRSGFPVAMPADKVASERLTRWLTADSRRVTPAAPVATWSWPVFPSAVADDAGSASCAATVSFAYAPVLVCRAPKSTVGIGDAISAAGLAAHLRNTRVGRKDSN